MNHSDEQVAAIAQMPTPRTEALLAGYPQLHLRPMELREERILVLARRLEQERGYAVALLDELEPILLAGDKTETLNAWTKVCAFLSALSREGGEKQRED